MYFIVENTTEKVYNGLYREAVCILLMEDI